MEERTVDLYLQDEIPRIGAGFRPVTVKLGRKWAHVTYQGRNHRIPIKKWRALEAKQRNLKDA